ncbi:MAG TPA: PA0069 family radical SAM protein [Steroidobacteraceae bacterium]|nr:PA0069 family radical SAM protein [Steroidobacteraceae bacterium]
MTPPRQGTRPLKGRGALSNPSGRFERRQREAVDDGWFQEELPDFVPTSLEPDRARSVITRNDSPDIPFEQSINPYRGCSHGCVWCMGGDTSILMGDGSVRPLAKVNVGSEIYGTERRGSYRRYVRTGVLAHWSVIKPAYRIRLADDTELVAGGDHRFLTERGWKFVSGTMGGELQRPYLTTNNKLVGTGKFADEVEKDSDYKRGYLCGMLRGDAHLGAYPYRLAGGQWSAFYRFRLALCDTEALYRAQAYLLDFEIIAREFVFQVAGATRRELSAISTGARWSFERIHRLIAWPPAPSRCWSAGFLAGIFDAEGSFSTGILRISNTDLQIIDWVSRCLGHFGFRFAVEAPARGNRIKPIKVVRLVGGLREHLRFFHLFDPAISRKLNIEGRAVKSEAPLGVVSIEPVGTMRLYDITTGTGDFIANGVVSHNCYARPSHAYMGLSAGLDFETKLFYKKDAGKLLEEELAKPGYVCKPITLGANTDPYQPIERRMRVTREILEVLARCRHPVTVITKSALVLRDLDLLADLARDGLAGVGVSITSLDAELKRLMEPQAASPRARLETVRRLNEAGVPAGVMVAPVIPALTDHELEAILEASAAAGARWAGYVLLRLPHEVKDLFREWLAAHYPDRADHVMSILQQMRGGKDYDSSFGTRMRGTGPLAELLRSRFQMACRRLGLGTGRHQPPDTGLFRPPTSKTSGPQLSLEL